MAVGRAKRAAAGGRAEADGRDFVPVGGGVLLYGNAVRTGHAYAQSDGADIVCAVFGNNADCAAAGVAVCVFALWGTAEMGDLVRGALESVDKHQIEAGLALGLRREQVFFYIEAPLGLRRVLPGAVNLFTRMVKTSSLAALIGVMEVVKVGQQIIENSLLTQPNASLWVYGLIFVLYFLVCYPLSLAAARLERKWSV